MSFFSATCAPVGSPLREACMDLRREVFVVEQGVPATLEWDEFDDDASSSHFAVVHGQGDVLGTVRWIVEPPGFEAAALALGDLGHLQRLAVRGAWRGRGVGSVLVSAVEAEIRERGLLAVYLAAQATAVPFYERLGYVAYGAAFVEAGLDHRHMLKRL